MQQGATPAVRGELLDTVENLVHEFEEYPAGSVLRCFSRAVAAARLLGTPAADLAEVAAHHTRVILAQRRGPSAAAVA